MIMCLGSKNAYESRPIMDRSVGVRKTRDNRDMSNNAPNSYNYLKLACDFKSILKYYCNREEE